MDARLKFKQRKVAIYWLVFVLFLPFDLIKAGATQTKTSLLKQYVAGDRVDLLDEDSLCSQQAPNLFSGVQRKNSFVLNKFK